MDSQRHSPDHGRNVQADRVAHPTSSQENWQRKHTEQDSAQTMLQATTVQVSFQPAWEMLFTSQS